MIILSILIPSIPSRSKELENLKYDLAMQVYEMNQTHPTLGEVEIISDNSKRFLDGGLTIGNKCNVLLMRATGKYLCYLHDDDEPAPNYVETLVRLCHQNQDVVTFRNFTKTDFYWTVINMSLGAENEQSTPEKVVQRNCWNICPIRSSIAKRHTFSDLNYGEDADWLHRVLPECHTEAHTDQILHSYIHSSKTSEADQIIKQGYV